MLVNRSHPHLRLLTFLMIILTGFIGHSLTAMADQTIQTFPGGSAESLLNNTQDPEWKKQEVKNAQTAGASFSAGLQCEIPGGKTVKQGEAGFDGCASQNADAMSKRNHRAKKSR